MSGCYRCGLPEGSDSRLCETCFSHRFNHGDPLLSGDVDPTPVGPEFTPTMRRWLLSGGAAIYIGVVGLGLLAQSDRIEMQRNAFQPDLIRQGGNEFSVDHRIEFAFLAGPLGDTHVE